MLLTLNVTSSAISLGWFTIPDVDVVCYELQMRPYSMVLKEKSFIRLDDAIEDSGAINTYVIRDLAPRGSYQFRLRYKSEDGWQSWRAGAATEFIDTLDGPPSPPGPPTATLLSASVVAAATGAVRMVRVAVTWPMRANCIDYELQRSVDGGEWRGFAERTGPRPRAEGLLAPAQSHRCVCS